MNTKIEEIYSDYVEETKGNIQTTIEIQHKIEKFLRDKRDSMDQKDLEQYKDQMYEIASIGEKNGFINGFRYGVMLMAECYAGTYNITVEPGQF